MGRVAPHAQAINEIKISDGRAGEGASPWFLHFDHDEIDEGPMGHFLEDRYLRAALLGRWMRPALVTHRAGTLVTGQAVAAGGVSVMLASGEELRAPCWSAATGGTAGLRARAGIARSGWDYRQTALVCAVEHALPHRGIAHQFFMPAGPLAILPLPGNRSSIVWTESRDRAEAIAALDDAGYLAELRPRFGDFLGEIALAGARFSYPLGLSLADGFDRPAGGAGGRRGAWHPSAGRAGAEPGAARCRGAGRGGGGGAAARARHRRGGCAGGYRRWRRFDTAMLAAVTDGLNRLFSNDNPLLRFGRDLGLGLVNRLPPLRRALIREAAGLSGDLPLLLRGRGL